jgi:nitrite reductase/ring-hydroxylating ferredoxin subunit
MCKCTLNHHFPQFIKSTIFVHIPAAYIKLHHSKVIMLKLIKYIIPLLLLITSCKKDDTGIPYVRVDIYIYTTDPNFVNLNAVGGWVYITGGSRGIIVYRSSNTEFKAYDRHCPYKPEDACGRVEVDSSNIQVVDPCCGSKFLLPDGGVTQGPAGMPLKSYGTSFDGSVLHIYD